MVQETEEEMKYTEDQFRQLKKKVEDIRAEAERAKGAMNQIKADLMREFQCETLKAAKRKLEEIRAKHAAAETKLEKMMSDYESKWK